jgi:hypothetical protein
MRIRMTYTQSAYFLLIISPLLFLFTLEPETVLPGRAPEAPWIDQCLRGFCVVSFFTGVLMLYTIKKKKRDEEKAANESWATPQPNLYDYLNTHPDREQQLAEGLAYVLKKFESISSTYQDPIVLWKEECAFLECEKIIESNRYPPLLKDLAKRMLELGPLLSDGRYSPAHESLLFIGSQCEKMLRAQTERHKAGLQSTIPPENQKFYSATALLLDKIRFYII